MKQDVKTIRRELLLKQLEIVAEDRVFRKEFVTSLPNNKKSILNKFLTTPKNGK